MKKEMIANVIRNSMNILIIAFAFFNEKIWKEYYWGLILGIYWGWVFTRKYYKKREVRKWKRKQNIQEVQMKLKL